MNYFEEFLCKTAIVDEDLLIALLIDNTDDNIEVPRYTLSEIIRNDWNCYSYREIFNMYGLDILGITNGTRYKEILESGIINETYKEFEEFNNLIINEFENSGWDCIRTCNGLMINHHGCDVDFEPEDKDYLRWKYYNYDEFMSEVDDELELSDEYIETLITII